jgi:hypothetical protein
MKVLLCTPAYGGQVTEGYFQSIMALLHAGYRRGIQIDVMTLTNESLITRGRNECVATFMGGDWTHLFWVDADIRFSPEHVFRLLDSDHEVSATPYAMKGLNWNAMATVGGGDVDALRKASIHSVINVLPGASEVDGFIEAYDAGTGFMCIQRSVLERLIAAHPELEYASDGVAAAGAKRWAIFDVMIENGRYLSEDYTFCRRWQTIGGKVWVDVQSPLLGHQGSYTYGR